MPDDRLSRIIRRCSPPRVPARGDARRVRVGSAPGGLVRGPAAPQDAAGAARRPIGPSAAVRGAPRAAQHRCDGTEREPPAPPVAGTVGRRGPRRCTTRRGTPPKPALTWGNGLPGAVGPQACTTSPIGRGTTLCLVRRPFWPLYHVYHVFPTVYMRVREIPDPDRRAGHRQ